jgi:hypothetical protein
MGAAAGQPSRSSLDSGFSGSRGPGGNPSAGGPVDIGAPAPPSTPARPAAPSTSPSRAPTAVRPDNVDPHTFWTQHFKASTAVGTTDLWLNVAALGRDKKFTEIQEVLRAYLETHGRDAEPWMYELLAVTLELNGRPREQVQTALGYAADLAVKARHPFDLTRVADSLHLQGMDDRAGQLLDLAASIDPGQARPLIMSVNLALATRDPARMGDAAERLLALGWPGTDETWRVELRKQVEDLAAVLQTDGQPEKAQALLDRLAAAEPRDLVLHLRWQGDADLDLLVSEPLGAETSVLRPRSVFGGAILANGYGKRSEETYVCPRGFDGTYKVRVQTVYSDDKDPAHDVTLEAITHEGSDHPETHTYPIDLAATSAPPIEITLKGGRRTTVLPYQGAPEEPVSLRPGSSAPTPNRPSAPTPAGAADALRP